MPSYRYSSPMCIANRYYLIDQGTMARTEMFSSAPRLEISSNSIYSSQNELLHLLEGEAAQFAKQFINDSNVRKNYLREIASYSKKILSEVQSGKISLHEGHLMTHKMRNTILDASRLKSSDIGRAYAESLKTKGVTLESLYTKYADKLYKKPFEALSDAQRNAVKLEIIESAGRNRPGPTRTASRLGALGKALWVLTMGIAIYNISTAEDKVKATARESFTIGGGVLGGAASGAVAGLACGPGALVCSTVLVLVGGGLGALGMRHVFDWIWE